MASRPTSCEATCFGYFPTTCQESRILAITSKTYSLTGEAAGINKIVNDKGRRRQEPDLPQARIFVDMTRSRGTTPPLGVSDSETESVGWELRLILLAVEENGSSFGPSFNFRQAANQP